MITVITYGTFDLFHIGHLNLLRRLKSLGDRLLVGVSTDEFNAVKQKKTTIAFEERLEIVSAIRYVDGVFAEENWDQKVSDIQKYHANIFGMGDDWKGKFDYLNIYAQVCYLPRTDQISSTAIKQSFIKPLHSTNLSIHLLERL
jgi:glycerol-3-phosphate cytidylyltransferase